MFTHLVFDFTFDLCIFYNLDNGDLVSQFFLRKKRNGLLSFFNQAKESLLPQVAKKPY